MKRCRKITDLYLCFDRIDHFNLLNFDEER